MLSSIKLNFAQKLKVKAYRAKFFRGQAQDEIASALLTARKKRGLTQTQLEKLSGMKQSAISRIEQASYAKWNFGTLLKLAEALDVRVHLNFDYGEDVIAEYERFESMNEMAGDNQIVPHEFLPTNVNEAVIDGAFTTQSVPSGEPLKQLPC